MYKRPPPKNVIDENDPRVSQFGHPAPPWLINYADLMTELVCFFIILYALSAVLNTDIRKAKQALDKLILEENLQAQTKLTKEGVRFTLEEEGKQAYFKPGKAELSPRMTYLMTKIGPLLKNMPNEIVIEGHTDNVPISTDSYLSNWELSSARAHSVLHHLIDLYGIEPTRISAIGYGEFRPCALNDTIENKAKNRRVVFFIKNAPPKPEIEERMEEERKKKLKEAAEGHKTAPPGQEDTVAPPAAEPATVTAPGQEQGKETSETPVVSP